MANSEIKEVIKNFVNFDIEKNYYQKEEKEELVRNFKKILFEDETTVRKFIKAFLESAKKLAFEYSLIGSDSEVEEIPVDVQEPVEEIEDATEEQTSAEESFKIFIRKTASDILYE